MNLLLDNQPSESELLELLNKLIQNWETEVAEFKEAGKDYDKNKIGQYFSAISNEANLKGLQHGWLVFGVRNKNKEIVGSDYRNTKGLDTLKQEISVGTTGGISFIEIYEVYPEVRGEKKRVILSKFQLRQLQHQLVGMIILWPKWRITWSLICRRIGSYSRAGEKRLVKADYSRSKD